MRTTVLWAIAAVGGVLLVAAITLAASTLTTQDIALSSEPLTAGDQLAPRTTPTATPARKKKRTPKPRVTATPTPTAVPTVDDHGGDDSSGHGSGDDSSGRGRGGDDD